MIAPERLWKLWGDSDFKYQDFARAVEAEAHAEVLAYLRVMIMQHGPEVSAAWLTEQTYLHFKRTT